MTVREIVYMILDEFKNASDDRYFEEEHIIYLINKYRAFLLKQRYGTDLKKSVPESNYQEVDLDLVPVSFDEEDVCYSGPKLKSSTPLPYLLQFGSNRVYSVIDFTVYNITLISRDRFNFVGSNKWLKNIIYATIGPDGHLYFKSANPQYLHLNSCKVNGVFEDFLEASKLIKYEEDSKGCALPDILDREFPIESALVPTVITLVTKDLMLSIYAPKDDINDEDDNLENTEANTNDKWKLLMRNLAGQSKE